VILIAYDASEDAKEAVSRAARLFPGQPAEILTVWQRFIDTMARSGITIGAPEVVDIVEVDQSAEQSALETAEAAAAEARELGLEARGACVPVQTTVADAIVQEANRIDADAIVMGSRGLGGVKSVLIGSVSRAVLHHTDRAVVIVPSPGVAAERAQRLSED
jgi:nucleotide-binding universal stress UspA family protein